MDLSPALSELPHRCMTRKNTPDAFMPSLFTDLKHVWRIEYEKIGESEEEPYEP